jgi:hypothetical protein
MKDTIDAASLNGTNEAPVQYRQLQQLTREKIFTQYVGVVNNSWYMSCTSTRSIEHETMLECVAIEQRWGSLHMNLGTLLIL